MLREMFRMWRGMFKPFFFMILFLGLVGCVIWAFVAMVWDDRMAQFFIWGLGKFFWGKEQYWLTAAFILIPGLLMFRKFCYRPWWHKKRTKQLGVVAENLGLHLVPISDNTPGFRLRNFHLFRYGGQSREWRNVIETDADEVKMFFCDYSYTTVRSSTADSAGSTRTYRQSILHFRSPSLRLPKFRVCPVGLAHKIGLESSVGGIDFQTHPKFSKKYLLRGKKKTQICELFNDNVLTLFETQNKISVEGDRDQFVIYRPNKFIKPDELKQLIDEGLRLFALLNGPTKV